MNLIGVAAAGATFLGIWFGHVAVRKIEAASPSIWLPAIVFAAAGIGMEWLALTTPARALEAAFGILGVTFLWDAIECHRQARRIRKGHAPANPSNRRHAALLSQPGSLATTVDPLKREPVDGKL